jgi:hypothetical protein
METKAEVLEVLEEPELQTLTRSKPFQIPEVLQVMERNWYSEHGDPFMT